MRLLFSLNRDIWRVVERHDDGSVRVEQIEAQIAAQQASNTEARLAVDRKRELAKRGLLTPQDLEAAEAQLRDG